MVKICPHCNQRVVTDRRGVDVIHKCNTGNTVLDKDTIPKVGDWDDSSGTGSVTRENMINQIENSLHGTQAGIEGNKLPNLNDRGETDRTHRYRQHSEVIKL